MTCGVYESVFQRHLRQVEAFKAEMRNDWMAASEAVASKALYATIIFSSDYHFAEPYAFDREGLKIPHSCKETKGSGYDSFV